MFILRAQKNMLSVLQRESVTSGSINVYDAAFEFSEAWDGLDRTAVFRAGSVSRIQPLDEAGRCPIPWEVLERPGVWLYAGVYGTLDEKIVLPTIWTSLGIILEGVETGGKPSRPPGPDGEETAADHRELAHRDAEGQHPIDAISGLRAALEKIPVPMTAEELRKILMNGGLRHGR